MVHNEDYHSAAIALYKTAHPRRRTMSSTDQALATEAGTLQELARRHLWMHFTRLSAYGHAEVPIIVRGEGCYVYDEHGKRYLDALSALFCVNIGHGRADVVQAGAEQAKELGFSRTGPTPTRRRSSWRRGSPRSRPAT